MRRTWRWERPSETKHLVPAMPSGRFETITAARKARLTEPPKARPVPKTSDSGIPSSNVPRKIAAPGPAVSSPAPAPAAGAFLGAMYLAIFAAAAVDHPITGEEGQGARREGEDGSPARLAQHRLGHEVVCDTANQRAGSKTHYQAGDPVGWIETNGQYGAKHQRCGRQTAPEGSRQSTCLHRTLHHSLNSEMVTSPPMSGPTAAGAPLSPPFAPAASAVTPSLRTYPGFRGGVDSSQSAQSTWCVST